jgi:predicted dehydrogenase
VIRVPPVRIGLVGYGKGGRFFHAPLIRRAEACVLGGVVVRSPERRAADAATFVIPDDDGQTARLLAGGIPTDDGEAWGAVPEDRWGRIHRAGDGVPVPSLPGAWHEFYAGLARALRGEAPLPVHPWDSVAGLEVLDAARVSAATGRVVELGATSR